MQAFGEYQRSELVARLIKIDDVAKQHAKVLLAAKHDFCGGVDLAIPPTPARFNADCEARINTVHMLRDGLQQCMETAHQFLHKKFPGVEVKEPDLWYVYH